MKEKLGIHLRGNLSGGFIVSRNKEVPDNLWVARAVCHVFPDFQSAAFALEQEVLPTVSAIVIQETLGKEGLPLKKRFSQAFRNSVRFTDSFVVAMNESAAQDVDGLVFYPEKPKETDLLHFIRKGDILDYQIPLGNFTLDLPPEGIEARIKGENGSPYLSAGERSGICCVQERYSRIYLIRGETCNLMIDCGFGGGNLKQLQKEYADGKWITVLTHGHADHAAGCVQFEEIYGNRVNLENAGIAYRGILHELRPDLQFDLGGRIVTAIPIFGHSAKDFAFWIEPERILVSGDAIAAGPNYVVTKGACLDTWIASIKALLERNLSVKKIYCSHRTGELEPKAMEEMLKGLMKLKDGRRKRYGASVYGVGTVFWSGDSNCSFFYRD